MNKEIKIYFDRAMEFEPSNIQPLSGVVGLYFIFSESIEIQYPFDTSKLLYIGMSEKRTNSVGKRLQGHFEGSSKNFGLINYRKVEPLKFTYMNIDMFSNIWEHSIEQLESYFILDFVEKYGVYPICNNKSGFDIQEIELSTQLNIDWNYFK